TYLARVRNPNPKMPDFRAAPASWDEYKQANGDPLERLGEEGQHAGHGEPAAHGGHAAASEGKGEAK
ncbi:MAG: hypothetical protein WCL11_12915, partial [Verrucomicrobiota bacterium]